MQYLNRFDIYSFLWALSLSVVLYSCADEDDSYLSSEVVASFDATLGSPLTRVTDTGWSSGDEVGVYMLKQSGGSITNASFAKYKPSVTGTSLTAMDGELYYPVDGSNVRFLAFAPYKGTTQPADNKVTYTLSGQTTSNINEKDLVYCDGKDVEGKNILYYSKTSKDATLNFKHKLSKVIITLSPEAGVSQSMKDFTALVSAPISVTFDIGAGSLTNGASGSMELVKTTNTDSKAVFELIVAPHVNTSRTVEFKLNGTSFSVNQIGQEYLSGNSYTYNYTLAQSGIKLTNTNVSIWGTGDVSWVGENYMSTDKSLTLDGEGDSGNITIYTNAGPPTHTLLGTNTGWLTLGSKATPAGTDTYTLSYTAASNPNMASRTANIAFQAGKVKMNVTVTQLGAAYDSSKPIVTNEDANCYILSPGGAQVLIPVRRAHAYAAQFDSNRPGLVAGDEFIAELLWVDEASGNPTGSAISVDKLISSTNVIQKLNTVGTGPDGYIYVQSGSLPGNAVITIKKKITGSLYSDVLWSWHIWVTAGAPNTTNIKSWNNGSITTYFMDRNLGATSATPSDGVKTYGLHYQWGRKDPFPYTASTKPFWIRKTNGTYERLTDIRPAVAGPVSISTAVVNLDIFYKYNSGDFYDWCIAGENQVDGTLLRWMNKSGKAFDDPCPQGWKVPNDGVWNGLTNDNFPWDTTNKGRSNATIGWYPAAGYRELIRSGSLYNVGGNGTCWSAARSTSNEGDAYRLHFNDVRGVDPSILTGRALGVSVRCVPE